MERMPQPGADNEIEDDKESNSVEVAQKNISVIAGEITEKLGREPKREELGDALAYITNEIITEADNDGIRTEQEAGEINNAVVATEVYAVDSELAGSGNDPIESLVSAGYEPEVVDGVIEIAKSDRQMAETIAVDIDNITTIVDRTLGVEAHGETEDDVRQQYQEIAEQGNLINEETAKLLALHEREKTETDLKLFALSQKIVGEARMEMGLPPKKITTDMLHIVDDTAPFDFEGEAVWSAEQYIAIVKQTGDVKELHAMVHELFHAESFESVQFNAAGNANERRQGLNVAERGRNKFVGTNVDEAITELLSRQKLKEHTDEICRQTGWNQSDIANNIATDPSYNNEIAEVEKTIHILSEKSGGEFSESAVFDALKAAKFKGDLVPIGRMLDGTFGKGALRKWMEAAARDAEDYRKPIGKGNSFVRLSPLEKFNEDLLSA
jgi:hypothetical protein